MCTGIGFWSITFKTLLHNVQHSAHEWSLAADKVPRNSHFLSEICGLKIKHCCCQILVRGISSFVTVKAVITYKFSNILTSNIFTVIDHVKPNMISSLQPCRVSLVLVLILMQTHDSNTRQYAVVTTRQRSIVVSAHKQTTRSSKVRQCLSHLGIADVSVTSRNHTLYLQHYQSKAMFEHAYHMHSSFHKYIHNLISCLVVEKLSIVRWRFIFKVVLVVALLLKPL